jgi:uracil-DNA glycosylase
MSDPRDELRDLTRDLRRHLEVMRDIGVHSLRCDVDQEPEPVLPVAAPPARPIEAPGGLRTLQVVRDEVGECTRCKLSATRTKLVFGVGADETPLMFVGEAPGAEEDRRGEPFVGAAGQLLDRMIAAMGWTRETVYIANVLMCRPPGNRDPQPDEVSQCLPFLHRKIEVIRPRIIVSLGKPATHALLSTTAPISALRGRFHDFRGIKVMPTFHPAFLLRQPDRKRDAWSDLKQVIEDLERIGVRSPNPPKV